MLWVRISRMFVIVKHGGKQYWAEPGALLALEKIDAQPGDTVELDTVATEKLGKVDCSAGKIKAQVVKHYRDDKVIVFKKKRRHHYERKKGHRQDVTQVKIAA